MLNRATDKETFLIALEALVDKPQLGFAVLRRDVSLASLVTNCPGVTI
jgi:hypothetical protein